MSEVGKWVHSTSEEYFQVADYFDTKADAILDGREEYEDEGFYVGQVASLDDEIRVSADSILDEIAEGMWDRCGDVADGYLDNVKKSHIGELEAELTSVVNAWMERHNYKPDFFSIENLEFEYVERNRTKYVSGGREIEDE